MAKKKRRENWNPKNLKKTFRNYIIEKSGHPNNKRLCRERKSILNALSASNYKKNASKWKRHNFIFKFSATSKNKKSFFLNVFSVYSNFFLRFEKKEKNEFLFNCFFALFFVLIKSNCLLINRLKLIKLKWAVKEKN